MVGTFLDDLPKRLVALRQAVAAPVPDAAAVSRIAHALKGSALTVGATTFAQLGEHSSSCATREDVAGAATLLDAMGQEAERVRAAFAAGGAGPPPAPTAWEPASPGGGGGG